MAITVKHSKVSTIPDDADTSLVRPSDWNADHTLVGTVPVANGGTGAATLTGYVKGNGTLAMTASATVPSTDVTGLGTMASQNANNVAITGGSLTGTTVAGYIPTADEGVANGVATLDSAGKVPISQIPDSVIGALSYQGTWNASTNTPTLTSSVGTKGYYYVVSVAGSTNLNGVTDWLVGDWAVYNGSVWQKVDNTDSVTSVNGFTGAVVLTASDVGAQPAGTYVTSVGATSPVASSGGTTPTISMPAATTSVSGYLTSTDWNTFNSKGTGDVVGPASATDNAVARFDATTGKLIQNSVVTIGDTGAATGFTTLAASTSVTTPIVQASNSGGLALKNFGGTTQMSVGAGGGDNMSINVSTNINGTNAQIDISPTGTGHVHIKPSGTNSVEIAPTNVGTMDNMTIGATTARAITGTTITGTSFVGSGASLTNVVNSLAASTGISVSGSTGAVTVTNTAPDQTVSLTAGTGISTSGTYPNFTITNTSPSSGGTVTSVTGTAPVVSSGGNTPAISMAAATTSVNGYLTSTDWTTFNGKQATLVSGTNIKTINTNSILGSGDLTISASAAGSNTQVQYNNSGAFAGSAGFLYDNTNGILSLGGSTGALTLPTGTTAQRPSSPVVGMSRYNTTTSSYEVYNGSAWLPLSLGSYSYTATYLVVAGGGGGGGGIGGAGGAGGYQTGTATLNAGTSYTITVGSGGARAASNTVAGSQGSNSVFNAVTSTGGGGGGAGQSANGPTSGGSGGGGTAGSISGAAGTSGQGNTGGNGINSGSNGSGGGGGASAVGGNGTSTTGGNGGAGTASSITGTSVTYAGGGGGGIFATGSSGGSGGAGGGGAGTTSDTGATSGTANTGGGGGGGGYSVSGGLGGNGGSGVVILSVPTANYSGNTTGSPTVATSGANTILTFTASGSYTA